MNAYERNDKKIAGLVIGGAGGLVGLRKLINEEDSGLKEEWEWGLPSGATTGLPAPWRSSGTTSKMNFRGSPLKDRTDSSTRA